MDATSALACPHEFVVSIPNPFPVEHCVALLSLALVYAWWVRIRPTPIPGMRALVIAAAPSCVGVMLGLSAGAYDMEDVNDTLGFGLSAASVVTVALLVELLCHAPSPIARAVARRHRRKPLTRENLSTWVPRQRRWTAHRPSRCRPARPRKTGA